MPPRVVLDADVLVPMALCDTLLRLARVGAYDPLWSTRILEEVRTTLVSDLGIPADKADHRIQQMLVAFTAATVADDRIAELEPSMTNDAKDRHVLAAGVAGGAALIVTRNVRDFPASACEVHGIEAVRPDDFLLGQFGRDPNTVRDALARQRADLTNPPMSTNDLLEVLRTWAPRFVAAFSKDLGIT